MSLWGKNDGKTPGWNYCNCGSMGPVTGSSTAFTTADLELEIIFVLVEKIILSLQSHQILQDSVIAGVPGATLTAVVGSGASYTLSEKCKFVTTSEATSTNGIHGDPTKVFGVDTTEIGAGGDNVVSVTIVDGGSSYKGSAPSVSFSGGGGSSAGPQLLEQVDILVLHLLQ